MVGHGLMPDDCIMTRPGESRLLRWKLPTWQRPYVWTSDQERRLIESIWLGIPIASYVYNHIRGGGELDGILVDGQQRWTAISRYVNDGFPVFGYMWSQLTELDRRSFRSTGFPCIMTDYTDEDALRDLYDRLAYGGTPHTKP